MVKLTKIFLAFLFMIAIALAYPGTTSAASEKKQTKIEIIKEMKKEIEDVFLSWRAHVREFSLQKN